MRLIAITEYSETMSNMVTTAYSNPFNVIPAQTVSVQCNADVNTPANKAFTSADVNTTANTITAIAHGFTTGLKIQVTTTGTLPDPLVVLTDYFIIAMSADLVKVAASLVNALAGTAIDLTTAGAGSSSMNPVAIAGGNVKLQKSNDGANWADEGSATNITADATLFLEKVDPAAKQMRVAYTLTAGRISAVNYILAKGPN